MTNQVRPFFWVDLEMTGLDETHDSILEVAIILTDHALVPLATFHRVIYQPPEVLEKMDDWCQRTHRESGLTALIPQGAPLLEVEEEILKWIEPYFSPQDRIVLVGNSIYNDKRFLDRYLLKLSSRLHYRMIDVSSFKEVFREKYGLSFSKKNQHRAIDDILESIEELKFYLSHIQVS